MSFVGLYKVTLRGMTNSWGVAYAVAPDAESAYQAVRREAENRKLGFSKDRALEKVELVAECAKYPECGVQLLFSDEWIRLME